MNIRRMYAVSKKEMISLLRDPMSLGVMIVLPIILLLLYGYAASLDVQHIPVAILDHDKTMESRNFYNRFAHNKYFNLEKSLYSDNDITETMDRGDVKMIINIPYKFAQNIHAGHTATVQILVDGSDATWAQSAVGYAQSISQGFESDLVRMAFIKRGQTNTLNAPINCVTRVWYNQSLDSMMFFVPGLVAMILMQVSAVLTSLTIISEKEQGTMESLIVSPVRKYELMLGKILPYVFITMGDVLLITFVSYYLFDVPIKGSYLLLLFCSFTFLIGTMALGLLISTTATTSQAALQMATMATMLPSMLLSGLTFPIANMPWALQVISLFIPARYFVEINRAIFLKGVGLEYFWPSYAMMAILSLLLIVLCVNTFKKRLD